MFTFEAIVFIVLFLGTFAAGIISATYYLIQAVAREVRTYLVLKRLDSLAPYACLSGKCDALLFSRYRIRVEEAVEIFNYSHANYLLNRLEDKVSS